MDPYQRALLDRLGDADPIEVLHATPVRLLDLAERMLPPDWSTPLTPGGWCAGEVVAHLADVELAFGFRIRQGVAGTVDVQPFDHEAWSRRYPRLDPSLALDAFRSSRAWNLALFSTFDLDDWLTELVHPETGLTSVDVAVRAWAGHDLRHLDRLAGRLPG